MADRGEKGIRFDSKGFKFNGKGKVIYPKKGDWTTCRVCGDPMKKFHLYHNGVLIMTGYGSCHCPPK